MFYHQARSRLRRGHFTRTGDDLSWNQRLKLLQLLQERPKETNRKMKHSVPSQKERREFQGAESLMICSSLMNVSVPTVCSHAAPLSTHQTTRKANPCSTSPKRLAPAQHGSHYQVSKLDFSVIYCSVSRPERLKNTASVKPQKKGAQWDLESRALMVWASCSCEDSL